MMEEVTYTMIGLPDQNQNSKITIFSFACVMLKANKAMVSSKFFVFPPPPENMDWTHFQQAKLPLNV